MCCVLLYSVCWGLWYCVVFVVLCFCHDFGYVRLGNVELVRVRFGNVEFGDVALDNVELFGSVVCGMSVVELL